MKDTVKQNDTGFTPQPLAGTKKREWFENEDERTAESRTFYKKTILKAGETSDLFDSLKIDPKILKDMEVAERKEGNKTVRTYTYAYSGYRFFISADVQALQTENIKDALSSKWGVENVGVSGNALALK